jgi:protein phosphatase
LNAHPAAGYAGERLNLNKKLCIPEWCVVLLVGPSSAGKSTFAKQHFSSTEVLSSDHFRALVSDDENDQSATQDAFDLLYLVAQKRLLRKKLCLIDATNLRPSDRRGFVDLARESGCGCAAIVLNLPLEAHLERTEQRQDRQISPSIVRAQFTEFHQHLATLKEEGFQQVYVLESLEEIESVEIVRTAW